MATTPVIPAAAPAAAAPTSAPAAAPSAPATTPTPASQPAVPASPAVAPSPGASLEDQLAAGWKAHIEKTGAEPAPADADVIDTAATVTEGSPAATDVRAAAEDATAETTTESKPDPAAQPVEPEYSFDTDDSLAPQAFFAEADKNPAVKEFFDNNPEIKNQVAGALRRDADNREIRTLIPDLDTAKMVTGAAATYQDFDNRFLSAETPEGYKSFMDMWVREAMLVDDKGQPVVKDGQYQIHPAFTNIVNTLTKNTIDGLAQNLAATGKLPEQFAALIPAFEAAAKSSGNDRLQIMADFLKEMSSPSSSAQTEYPPELQSLADSLKAQKADLEQREQAATRQRSETERAESQQSVTRAMGKVDLAIGKQLETIFTKAGLTQFESDAANEQISRQVSEALGTHNPDGSWRPGGNRLFQSIYDSILTRPAGPEREAALTRHILGYAQPVLGKISAAVVREAKAGTLQRQTATDQRRAEQTHQSRTEPRTASIAAPGNQAMNPRDLRLSIEKEYADSHGGTRPDVDFVMGEMAKRTGAFAPRPVK